MLISPGTQQSLPHPLQGHATPAQAQSQHPLQVWRWNEAQSQWAAEGPPLLGHADWVRDVAWAPSLGLPKTTLASAGQDGKALVWAEDGAGAWTPTELMTSEVRIAVVGTYVTELEAVRGWKVLGLHSHHHMPCRGLPVLARGA